MKRLSSLPLVANIRPRVTGDKCIHIKRSLSGKGKLAVNKNDEVAPHDILGKYKLSAGYSVINLSKMLGVSPSQVTKYLQKPVGTNIFRGELLAFRKSLLGKKYVTSPTDGLIEEYDNKTGEMRFKFLPKDVPLTAGVFGIVSEVDQKKGEVIIKTMATEIYGVYGFGRERSGILHILNNPSNLAQSSQLNAQMKNHIIVTGALIYMEALRKAASYGISGIISGGLNLRDFESMVGSFDPKDRFDNDVGITVVATEGFGPIPIGEDVFKVLTGFNGKYIFANGNNHQLLLPSGSQDSILSLRKIVLPISDLPDTPPVMNLGEIRLGNRVRIIWPPLMGSQGKVIGIDQSPTVLESGISTYMVSVETSKQKIKVPYPNIELI